MAQTIQIRRGTGSAVPSSLAEGELAINVDTGKLYFGQTSTSASSNFRFENLTAENYTVTSSVTHYSFQTLSGSSDFGDDIGDIHTRTGSLFVSGNASINGDLTVTKVNTGHGSNELYAMNQDVETSDSVTFAGLTVNGTTTGTAKIEQNGPADLKIASTHGSANRDVGLELSSSQVQFSIALDRSNNKLLIATSDVEDAPANSVVAIGTDGTISSSADLMATDLNLTGTSRISSTIGTITFQDHLYIGLNQHITASGEISASGKIYSSEYFKNGVALFTNPSFTGNVTASGDISSSGNIYTQNVKVFEKQGLSYHAGTDSIRVGSSDHKTEIQGENITLAAPVTASGNISASGEIKANTLDIASTSNFADDITLGDTKKLKGVRLVISASSNNNIYGTSTFHQNVNLNGGVDITGDSTLDGNLDLTATNAVLDIQGQGDASDATGDTGALRCEGGASIAKKLFVGTDLNIGGQITSNITASGNITTLTGTIKGATGLFSTISASGNNYASAYYTDNYSSLDTNGTQGRVFSDASITEIQIGRNGSPNKNIELLGPVTASGHISSSGTVTANSFIETSRTRIKILARDFVADDGGRPTMIEDDNLAGSDEAFLHSHASLGMFAFVDIPTGYTATHIKISGSDTGQNYKPYEGNIGSKSVISRGAATAINTELNMTDVAATDSNYLFIHVTSDGADDEIFGGYVTITPS